MKSASGPSNNITALAMSAGRPMRPAGMGRATRSNVRLGKRGTA